MNPSYDWSRLFFGTIEKVLEPDDPQNSSGYQFVYQVLITMDNYAQVPVQCIKLDAFGSYLNYDDAKLAIGYRVFVMFPRGDRSMGVIMGGSRLFPDPQLTSDGYYQRTRFNEFMVGIDKAGTWSATSDAGPLASISKTQVILDDSVGDNITLDKENKILTINANALTINVVGDANINVQGNLSATVKGDMTASAEGKATISSQGDMSASTEGNLDAKAAIKATITAPIVVFNQQGSGIVTANGTYNVVDFITGVPVIPSPTTYGDI